MKKHTPGEWIFSDYDGSIIGGEDGREIARISPGCDALSLDETGAEYAANVALIAAAPDLLEALLHLKHHLSPDGDYVIVRADGKGLTIADSLVLFGLPEEAISKALANEPG